MWAARQRPSRGKEFDTSSDVNESPQLSFLLAIHQPLGGWGQNVFFRSVEKGLLYFVPVIVRELDLLKAQTRRENATKREF